MIRPAAAEAAGEQPLAAYLQARRAEVEAALDRYLPVTPDCPETLAEAMRYSLLAGGKRLRPVLALATADAIDPDRGAALAMPAACAIEMIHTYSLVHDDLPAMDDDSLRRGRPTVHVAYGEAMAILAGDGLLTEAFRVLARWPDTDDPAVVDRKLRTVERVAAGAGVGGMGGGQVLDIQPVDAAAARRQPAAAARAALRAMHERKTGALIRAAAAAGAIMAGADRATIAAVDAYAAHLGLGFQIVDDILDVEGDTAALGKTAGKDAAAGKVTYPSLVGLEQSRVLAAGALGDRRGAPRRGLARHREATAAGPRGRQSRNAPAPQPSTARLGKRGARGPRQGLPG
ncbi:MAG: polyprenyl synthetase family protein, partial [Acidobacteria bacterium]|nr:polyprenyl synthetase family protein [Acidobacteriota bacterium]